MARNCKKFRQNFFPNRGNWEKNLTIQVVATLGQVVKDSDRKKLWRCVFVVAEVGGKMRRSCSVQMREGGDVPKANGLKKNGKHQKGIRG